MHIERMTRGSWGKTLAYFDVKTEEGFTMKGFRIVDGNDGLFVGFPSIKKDDKYDLIIHADKELKDQITVKAISYYHQEMEAPIISQEDTPF